jgi:hypothetical protein
MVMAAGKVKTGGVTSCMVTLVVVEKAAHPFAAGIE